jgi:hypothetical protein
MLSLNLSERELFGFVTKRVLYGEVAVAMPRARVFDQICSPVSTRAHTRLWLAYQEVRGPDHGADHPIQSEAESEPRFVKTLAIRQQVDAESAQFGPRTALRVDRFLNRFLGGEQDGGLRPSLLTIPDIEQRADFRWIEHRRPQRRVDAIAILNVHAHRQDSFAARNQHRRTVTAVADASRISVRPQRTTGPISPDDGRRPAKRPQRSLR